MIGSVGGAESDFSVLCFLAAQVLYFQFLAISGKYKPLTLSALQIDLYRGLPTLFFARQGRVTPSILP